MVRLFTVLLLVYMHIEAQAQIKPKQEDWFAYDFTHDYLLSTPDGVEQSWRSNGHSLSFMGDVQFGTSNFGLGYGLGFTSNNYFTNVAIATDIETGNEEFAIIGTDSIKHNKFNLQYIHVPLELRFRTDPNAKGDFFRLYLGGKVGVRINSYSRLKTEEANVQYNNLGALKRIVYGVYIRTGFSYFNFYAYYGLSGLFEEGTIQPDGESITSVTPLSVGISLTL